MTVAKLNYNDINWSLIFKLDNSSPSGLRWKHKPHGKTKIDDPAGYYKKDSGWIVRFNNKNYISHRIIFIMHYGYLDNNLIVDHFDGNNKNNSINNLRSVTETINARNKKKNTRNMSGFVGVRKEINKAGSLIYRAQWFDCGKLKSKCFNTNKYGEHAFELAKKYRIEKLKNLGYTDRHLHD